MLTILSYCTDRGQARRGRAAAAGARPASAPRSAGTWTASRRLRQHHSTTPSLRPRLGNNHRQPPQYLTLLLQKYSDVFNPVDGLFIVSEAAITNPLPSFYLSVSLLSCTPSNLQYSLLLLKHPQSPNNNVITSHNPTHFHSAHFNQFL